MLAMTATESVLVSEPASRDFSDGPLSGIRVIDLSAVISGPFGTTMLADQGADVILVERADFQDLIRASGPLVEGTGVSAMFTSLNRNKRTIALDLKQPEGRELLKDLVRTADVVVQNFRPGALDRLGVGWSVLSEINPQLIMCSISGFGQDGPYSHRPAFDPVVQSIAAYPFVQVGDDGRPNLMATAVCDKVTSMQVAQSILAALVGRANGAGGQHIEIAMCDVAVHFLWPEAMWNDTYLEHDVKMPNLNEIYKLYQSKDGWVMVYSVATPAHWRGMCTALGRADLAEDPRFADLQGRVRFGAAVNDEIQAETTKYTTAELVEMMDRVDVPVSPVNTRQSMIDDPHLRHRGVIVETDHPVVGRVRSVRPPAIYSKTPAGLRRHAPSFGEHTDEVLRDVLDKTPDEIRSLRDRAVVL
jgi:crotonobetainyl-CoA:carnitine CoA-transferase CaiB-like acyl-CoA transferase